jgi:hypothetical protein
MPAGAGFAKMVSACALEESQLLISRRREAKRRALLQMLDRIPVRSSTKTPQPHVRTPVEVALAPALPPQGQPARVLKQ